MQKKAVRINKVLPVVIFLVCLVLTALSTGKHVFAADSTQPVCIADGSQLIEQADLLDGTTVVVQGEIVGDIMKRGDHDWINVLIGGTAFGIWISGDQRASITYAGRYGVLGDRVRITGIYHRACREHGGNPDIHALSLEVAAKGHIFPCPIPFWKLTAAVGLLIPASVMLILLGIKKPVARSGRSGNG